MITESEIRQTLAALRYHNRQRLQHDPHYSGSTFEADTIAGIELLRDLADRMSNSDRPDFIGGEI